MDEIPSQPGARSRRFHWRRLFQFRMRTLLLLMAILPPLLGWWSYKARQQREAVAVIQGALGSISYDFITIESSPPRYLPTWLVEALGVDYFANVVFVRFSEEEVADDCLVQLQRLPTLRRLDVIKSKFTGKGLEHLKRLTGLKMLVLRGSKVNDADLKNLVSMKGLAFLELTNTQITDAGLEHVNGLTKVRQLFLDGTQVSDAGLKHLKSLQALLILSIAHTKVTDAGLDNLRELKQLEVLDLRNTQVTDAGIARLQKSLPNCRIER